MDINLTQQTKSILVVEDSATQAAFLEQLLISDGYEVAQAATGADAHMAVASETFDFILLDLGLPDMDGVELCTQLRESTDAFIIMVTGRTDSMDRVVGLGAGADDYVAKPFEPLELLLRLTALTRRFDRALGRTVTFAGITVDSSARTVTVGDSSLDLTRIEFDLLAKLASAQGNAVSKTELVKAAWGTTDFLGNGHGLTVHVANLKKKLAALDAQKIEAVRGIGYRLTN